MVKIQTEDFDVSAEMARLRLSSVGAMVSFVGTVRDLNVGDDVLSMILEHYPIMTEKSIQNIETQATQRWDIIDTLVIHRVGELFPKDQIVLVLVTSKHRAEAFAACEFIMDYLKTQAPFWKKEQTSTKDRWVDAKQSDQQATLKWMQD
jgi:molybdopterin synthase catalytic subunit